MKIINRKDFNNKLLSNGILIDKGTSWYKFKEDNETESFLIVIENVEKKERPEVLSKALKQILKAQKYWCLFPRYHYFNNEKEDRYFDSLNISKLIDEALEWDEKDFEIINKIMTCHFVEGCHTGWDLYMISKDFNILIMIDHDTGIITSTRDKQTMFKIDVLFKEASIKHELFYSNNS